MPADGMPQGQEPAGAPPSGGNVPPSGSTPPADAPPSGGGVPPSGSTPSDTTPPSGGGSRAWIWIVVAVVALLLIGGGVYLFAQAGNKVAVPNVVGRTEAEAKGLIEGTGLTIGTVTQTKETTLPPGTVTAQTPAGGEKVDKGSKVDLTVAAGPSLTAVPDVVGKTKDEAVKTIQDAGLIARVAEETSAAPKGQVFGQLPVAGSKVTTGSMVGIAVSTGPAQQTAKVPNVTGKPQATAENEIRTAGFVPVVFKDYSDTVAAGSVIGQLPDAGTTAVVGHEVALTVSLGKTPAPQVTVPTVTGKTKADAESAIKAVGLVPVSTAGYSETAPSGSVISQSPGGGTKLPKGGQVAILVSQGKPPVGGVSVPDVMGKTEADASSIITGAGLKPSVVKDYSDTVAAGIVAAQLPDAGSQVYKGSVVTILVSLGKGGAPSAKVPNVVGKTQSAAESALKSAGLEPLALSEPSSSTPEGNVGRQLPAAGKTVAPGSQVAILVSSGTPSKLKAVPDVKGKTKDEAVKVLEDAGFEPLVVEDFDAVVPAGQVFGQLPEAGTQMPAGAIVVVGVSKGNTAPTPTPLPAPLPASPSSPSSPTSQ